VTIRGFIRYVEKRIKMKKSSIITIVILTLLISIAIMTSGYFIKRSTLGIDFINSLNIVEDSIQKKEWEKANYEIINIQNKWNKLVNYMQFSVEREAIWKIDEGIAVVEGAIKVNDDNQALISINELKLIWEYLGN